MKEVKFKISNLIEYRWWTNEKSRKPVGGLQEQVLHNPFSQILTNQFFKPLTPICFLRIEFPICLFSNNELIQLN